MAENDSEWSPKTRDDWVGLFSDGHKKAAKDLQSEREEEEAKRAESEKASSDDKDGKGGSGDDSAGKGKRKSFAERLLGI